MLAIGFRYLCGWAMATQPTSRTDPEWPPHPDRVFMAMTAAHFETDGSILEHEALERLETLGPPDLAVSEFDARNAVTAYVPVNDVTVPRVRKSARPSPEQLASGLALLPDARVRQPRVFPVAVPHDPTVFLEWPDVSVAEDLRRMLEELCRKVTRVGHSASLVQMWLESSPPVPTLIPAESRSELRLRVPSPGRLAYLARQFEMRQRPSPGLWQGYSHAVPEQHTSIYQPCFDDDLIVFRQTGGRRLSLSSSLLLTRTFRAAILAASTQPVPEWISGHAADGRPSDRPHLAILPLGDVGHEHADGHVLGIALALPRDVSKPAAARALAPLLARAESGELRIYDGALLDCTFELDTRIYRQVALRPETWSGSPPNDASARWASVTPIVLDRYPKRTSESEALVAAACERIGLPAPQSVVTAPVSLFTGAPSGRAFPPMVDNRGARHVHTHAVVTFGAPVRGPILLGRGRYRGYGVCRPVRTESAADA